MKQEVIKLNIEEYGLEKETATSIEKSFLPFFKQAKVKELIAKTVKYTIEQTEKKL